MENIYGHISALRTLLKLTSDDSQYPDPFLYELLNSARGVLLYQELNKKGKLSDWNRQNFCIKLETDTFHDCGCIPNLDCVVLKSVVDIPKPITGKYGTLFKVLSVKGDIEYYPTTSFTEKLNRWSKTKANKVGWQVVNDKLVLFIRSKHLQAPPKVVLLSGIFEDPLELTNISACTEEGDSLETACYSLDQPYPMDAKFVQVAYDMVLRQLGATFPLTEDRKNNASNVVNQPVD